MKPKTIVLGMPRSGTTRIILLLREFYQDFRIEDEFVRFELCTDTVTINDQKAEFLRNDDGIFDLHKLVIYHLIQDQEINSILNLTFLETILETYDKVIYTRRKNIFDRILSQALAEELHAIDKSQNWYHFDQNTSENPYKKISSVKINLNKIRDLCISHKFQKQAEDVILNHPKTIVIDYEDTTRLSPYQVLKMVGIDANGKQIKDLVGKNSDLQWKLEHISNIEDVKRVFNRTNETIGLNYFVEPFVSTI